MGRVEDKPIDTLLLMGEGYFPSPVAQGGHLCALDAALARGSLYSHLESLSWSLIQGDCLFPHSR